MHYHRQVIGDKSADLPEDADNFLGQGSQWSSVQV